MRKLLLLFLFCFFNQIYSQNTNVENEIIKYIKKGSVIVAKLNGEKLFEYNSDLKLVPASTQKVIISLITINLLGENFKFYTDVFTNNNNDILIKGYGDPYFVSEDFEKFINKFLMYYKKQEINNIYLDDSFFDSDIKIPGSEFSLNPYEAPNSAISLNFNTILLMRKNNEIISAEPQTPMLDFTKKIINELKIIIKKENDYVRINLGRNPDNPALYFGNVFAYFLEEKGIKVKGKIEKKFLTNEFKNYYRYYSERNLSEILCSMLEHSNNFIANQLFIFVGAFTSNSSIASLEKSAKFINQYLTQKYLLKNTKLVEGSGLSRENYTTANDLLKIMQDFFKYKEFMRYNKAYDYYYKTGTLKDNNSVVGFYKSSIDNEWKIFIILLNQVERNRNKILEIILKNF